MEVFLKENTKIYVIPDLHEHREQFDKALEYLQPSKERLIVQCGDLIDKGFGKDVFEYLANKMKLLVNQRIGYMVLGNHEQKAIKKAKKTETLDPVLQWLSTQPLALSFVWPNGYRVTCVHAGVTPHMKILSDLWNNVNVCYVRELDENGKNISIKYEVIDGMLHHKPVKEGGVSWHQIYDDYRFGYIASGHYAQNDGLPKFYDFSCNLDCEIYLSGKLCVQEFSQMGLGETLFFTGEPKWKSEYEMRKAAALGPI